MRGTSDFITALDAISRARASGLPDNLAEAAIRAVWDEYSARANDIRFRAAIERLALFPPTKDTDGSAAGKPQAPKAARKVASTPAS